MSLRIEALSHAYARGEVVLKELDLEFAPGITGLLGTNGAGTSTLIRILATLTQPSRGRVRWQGNNALAHPVALRRVLGHPSFQTTRPGPGKRLPTSGSETLLDIPH